MKTATARYAKMHLPALLAVVERGDEVVISHGSKPLAKLVPIAPQAERELGFVPYSVPDDFASSLAEEELSAWEGR